jgi:hypothetical protein
MIYNYDIKSYFVFREWGGEYMEWIDMSQDRDRWRAFVKHGDEPSGSIKCMELLD